MSFWDLDDGGNAAKTATDTVKGEGGSFEPLPGGSKVLSEITEIKWVNPESDDARFIQINWSVLRPEEFEGRKLRQKLFVAELDLSNGRNEEKAKKRRVAAKKTLATLALNAGGKLLKLTGEPDDDDLAAALMGKQAVLGVEIFSIVDKTGGPNITGNWVRDIFPKQERTLIGKDVLAPAKSSGGGKSGGGGRSAAVEDDDEIPFD